MKSKFYLPDYQRGSIVNLMSSIGKAFGWKSKYKELNLLSSKEIKKYKNVVLIVIDGLGYEYLMEKGKGGFLRENLKGKMTSVFPPTTASAVTSFLTGVAPQQHDLTGWFIFFKEAGAVCNAFTFSPRGGGKSFVGEKIPIGKFVEEKGFFSKIKTKCFSVNPEIIRGIDYNKFILKGSANLYYKNMNGFFKQVKRAVNSKGEKYVYAYWPFFDEKSHDYGVDSKKAEKHFKKIDKKLKKFAEGVKHSDTLLIITSDHGFVDTPLNKVIWLEKHPKMKECLTLPLCGEGRVVYCYVHPSKTRQFENYIKIKFKKYCQLHKSEDLIRKNYFGFFKPSPKLFDRTGDYVLICKDNYVIKDKIKEKEKLHIGHHGGVSREEMLVPLVVVKA